MSRKCRNILLIVCIVLATVMVIEVAVLVYLFKQERYSPPATITASAEKLDVTEPDFVQVLDIKAAEYIDAESASILEYAAELERTEEGRRERARLKQEAEAKLHQEYLDMLKAQAELQEQLDAKAEAEIAALGGTNATKSDSVSMGKVPISQPPQYSESIGILPSEAPETTEPLPDPSYLGQFSATIVCTCASCFNAEKHPDAMAGEQYIVADPEYIKTGSTVTLNQCISGEFPVRDGTGIVNGRSIIVYCPNHSETKGGQLLYPKIYESED